VHYPTLLKVTFNSYQLSVVSAIQFIRWFWIEDCWHILTILLQIAFTLVFWLTLRQFSLECSTQRLGSRLDAESLETLNETDGMVISLVWIILLLISGTSMNPVLYWQFITM